MPPLYDGQVLDPRKGHTGSMVRVPMTAKEQLLLAQQAGHELSVVTRTFPEHPEAPPKFYVSCTCGWQGKVVRSYRAASGSMAWHLGKVLAEAQELARAQRNNGVSQTRPRPAL